MTGIAVKRQQLTRTSPSWRKEVQREYIVLLPFRKLSLRRLVEATTTCDTQRLTKWSQIETGSSAVEYIERKSSWNIVFQWILVSQEASFRKYMQLSSLYGYVQQIVILLEDIRDMHNSQHKRWIFFKLLSSSNSLSVHPLHWFLLQIKEIFKGCDETLYRRKDVEVWESFQNSGTGLDPNFWWNEQELFDINIYERWDDRNNDILPLERNVYVLFCAERRISLASRILGKREKSRKEKGSPGW